MLDQDFVTITRMQVLSNIYDTVAYMRSLQGENIHKLNDGQRRVIKYLLDNGMLNLNG